MSAENVIRAAFAELGIDDLSQATRESAAQVCQMTGLPPVTVATIVVRLVCGDSSDEMQVMQDYHDMYISRN